MSDAPSSIHVVYHHLAAPKAELYRSILQVFVEAKERFEIALRPMEIVERVNAGRVLPPLSLEEVATALESLRDWGNLSASRDMVSARTVEEFLKPKHLYQLSSRGDAAERALNYYENLLLRPGELSATALHEIGDTLEELRQLLLAPPLDTGKAVRALNILSGRFETLVARAQSFIGGLQRELDAPSAEETAFLALKEELLGYLERFVRELVSATYRISHALKALDVLDLAPLIHAAAAADLADVLAPTSVQRAQMLQQWENRWQGLRRWFIGSVGAPSQAEALRSRALAAIPALLERVRRINDQRANRSDLAADFICLARWFATAPANDDLHRLWRAAFGLASARHLRVNETTLQAWDAAAADGRMGWEDAPPYVIPITQWSRGHAGPRGAAPGIVDRSEARALLRAKAEAERQRLHAARSRLAALTPCPLSRLGPLEEPEFDVLLDAIGEAFARLAPGVDQANATTEDGGMQVTLSLPSSSSEAACLASIETARGTLRGPDFTLTLRLLDDQAGEQSAGMNEPSIQV